MIVKIPVNLAQEIGCSVPYVYKLNDGSRRPSLAMAKKIIRVMEAKQGVKLTLNDLRPDLVAFSREVLETVANG